MKTIIAVLAILSIATIPAYAELYEDTVRFDLFNNSTVSGSGCAFIEDEDGFYYNCQWFIETTNSTTFIDELKKSFEETIEEIEEEQGHDIGFEDIVETKLTPTELLIKRLNEEKDLGKISTADKELLRLLEATTKACEIGIEHGERIQSYGIFELPTKDPRLDTATDLKTNYQLGNIIKKFEECSAWNEYRFSHLGQQYLDIEVDDSTSQKHHRAMVQSLETYPVPRLSEHDFAETDKQAKEWICSASFYDRNFKDQAGCFDDVVIEDRNLPNPLDRNPAYTAYKEYMNTGFVSLETLKKQEVEKANAQSLSSFAQQHGIDIADLQNLIQSVEEYNESKINGAK